MHDISKRVDIDWEVLEKHVGQNVRPHIIFGHKIYKYIRSK